MNNITNSNLLQKSDLVYVWEILNLENKSFFQIENNSINFWKLRFVKKLEGAISQLFISFNQKEDELIDSNLFFNSDGFNFSTNDNPFPDKNKFYLYSKEDWTSTAPDFYYMDNNSQVLETGINQWDEAFLYEISVQNIKMIKNYNNNFFNFEKVTALSTYSEIPYVDLSFPNNMFVNRIAVMADIQNKSTNEITKNVFIPIKDLNNNISIPIYANPVTVNQTDFEVYLSNLNFNYNFHFDEVKKYLNNYGVLDIKKFFNNNSELAQIVEDLIFVSQTLASSFSNKQSLIDYYHKGSNEGRWPSKNGSQTMEEWFKQTLYAGNDAKHYCDFKIQEIIEKLTIINNHDLARKFLTLILCLSSHINSSYCWKGGLTDEHKLGLTFYLIFSGGQFYIQSQLFNFQNNLQNIQSNFNIALNNKNFLLGNKFISFPDLPFKLEAQNISNSPIDFNQSSFNLNYLSSLYIDKTKEIVNFLRDTNSKTVTNRQTLITDRLYKGSSGTTEERKQWMREALNIPDTAIVIGDIEVVDLVVKSYGDEGYYKGQDWQFKLRATWQFTNVVFDLKKNKFLFSSSTDLKKYLESKNLYNNINVRLALNEDYSNYKIIRIKKIVIKNLLGEKINLSFNGFSNKQINLFSKYNKSNSTTIINL